VVVTGDGRHQRQTRIVEGLTGVETQEDDVHFEPEVLLLLIVAVHDESLREELLIVNHVSILPLIHCDEHKAAENHFGQVEPCQA